MAVHRVYASVVHLGCYFCSHCVSAAFLDSLSAAAGCIVDYIVTATLLSCDVIISGQVIHGISPY